MRKNSIVKILSVLLLVALLFSGAPLGASAEKAAPQQAVVVEQAVLEEIQANGTASYMINFKYDVDLSPAFTMNWVDRGWFVYNTLVAQRDSTQAAVQEYLSNAKVEYTSFWINNSISVKQSDNVILNAIQSFEGVESITAPKVMYLAEPTLAGDSELMAIEPNISHVKATDVWGMGITGEGFTVANIDTGVRYTHEAVVNQYRGNDGGTFSHDYNWLDPYASAYQAPRDDNGHGTHTMGTMVGKVADNVNQIGMAPGADWMACRGCSTNQCAGDQLLACAQWVAAPTKMDGSGVDTTKRPVAVNNSWGDCDQTYDDWYQEVVDAWVAAGIYPVFSNGNNSNCYYPVNPPEGTVGNPARYGNVSGVGSTGQSNATYAGHSNKGPSDVADTINPIDGSEFVKPQFMAPGVAIRSSLNGSDTQYASYNGTSMSAPHVTGLIALIREAAPCLEDYGQIETLIQNTATEIDPAPGHTGGVPNNSVGWGEINAKAAVEAAMGMCGDYDITGTVKSNAEGNPVIAGAKVVLTPTDPEGIVRTTTTNAEGVYTTKVDPGTYNMVASKMGFVDGTGTGVVAEGQEEPTVVNFTLEALPAREITGTITDGGVGTDKHGYPLMATLTFTADDHTLTTKSDPFTGKYKITVFEDEEYTISVVADLPGYDTATRDIDGDSETVQDFELMVNAALCMAPGYKGAGVVEGFDNELPTGWTIQQYGTGGQWHFNDPKGRGNRTGGEGIFAMVDSDYYGYGNVQNTGLRTPTMNFTDAAGALVEFKSYFYRFTGQTAKVRYSLDGGETWVNIVELPSTTEQKDYSFDMSDEFSGQATVIVEFLFQASWGYYWQIDDVKISDGSCSKLAGGAVAGYAYDANEEDVKLTGVKFETEQNSYVSQENDFEPANGLYWFFEETTADPQDVEFTVSKSKYTTTIENVSVAQSELTRKDFELGSPKFVVSPESLERTIPLGDDDEYDTIYVKNIGTGAGEFGLTEVNKGFQPLYQPVPPRNVNIPEYTGPELVHTTPPSMDLKPSSKAPAGGPALTLSGSAKDFGINAVVPAYGNHVFATDLGVYKWPDVAVPGTWEKIGPHLEKAYAGDFLGSDFSKLYVVDADTKQLISVSTTDAAQTVIATITPPSGTVAGLSGAEGFFYGVTSNCGNDSTLFKMTPTGEVEVLGGIPSSTCAIDLAYIPSEGMIYIVDLVDGKLHKVDPANPAGSEAVGSGLGYMPKYAQSMDYDEVNGILYWAACNDDDFAQLRVIDTNTGNSTKIGDFNSGEITAFGIAGSAGGGGGGAVPWLDEDPVDGYVEPGEEFPVNITFTVKPIDQPGDYFAELRFTTDGATPVEPMPVTLHVTRPFTWGNIKGTVIASEKCDINPAPLAEATVNFYKDGELFKSTTTDENGYYSYALERGTYDVEIVSAEHVASRVNDVVVPVSDDVVVDFNLRHNSPCLSYEPEMLFAQLYPDQTTDKILTFRNTGAVDAVFEMAEVPGEGPVPYAMAGVELVLDDGSYDDAIGIGGNSQFLVVNRFTPEADLFPFTINEVQIYFETTVQAGDPFEIYLYQNETSQDNPAPGSEFLYKQAATVPAQNSWAVITLEEPVTFEGPGDVLIGAGFLKKPGAAYFPASIDETATQSRSWAGWYTGDIPSTPTLPPDDTWTKIDAAGIAGNWMIRGYGESGGGTPGDIPWLELDTTAGVAVADGGEVEITATFDSTGLTWGDYFGQLRVTNAPDPRFNIPVQLRVQPFNMMYLPVILRNFN